MKEERELALPYLLAYFDYYRKGLNIYLTLCSIFEM